MKNRSKGNPVLSWPWFIILIAAVSPIMLYTNNLGEVTLASLWRPLFFSIVVGLVAFGLSYLVFKNFQKAGLITGIIEIFIFSYGHLYNLIKFSTIFGFMIGRHRYLFPFLFLIFGLLIWWVIKLEEDLQNITLVVNIAAIVLIIYQFILLLSFEMKVIAGLQRDNDLFNKSASVQYSGQRPDIYIILLDGYMRSDWLEDSLGYDNSTFIQELKDLGFYIPPCSMSNYSYTLPSMTSELNMAYLENLFDPIEDIETSTILKHSEVRHLLEGLGYETVFFQNFYPWVDIKDGDYYLSPDNINNYEPFEVLFLQTTILTLPYDLLERQLAELHWSPDYAVTTGFGNLIQSIFNYLQHPHDYEGPVFVYAHILSPHYPYVMNADGTINYDWEDDLESSLVNTYKYLDEQTIIAVQSILANSDPEPIIIIQSDHGSGEKAYKNLTLNAFLLPDGGEEVLYPTLTPVNFFRLIFDYYFDMDFDLLADKSYYSEEDSRYNYEEVQEPYDYCQSLSN